MRRLEMDSSGDFCIRKLKLKNQIVQKLNAKFTVNRQKALHLNRMSHSVTPQSTLDSTARQPSISPQAAAPMLLITRSNSDLSQHFDSTLIPRADFNSTPPLHPISTKQPKPRRPSILKRNIEHSPTAANSPSIVSPKGVHFSPAGVENPRPLKYAALLTALKLSTRLLALMLLGLMARRWFRFRK